MSDPSDSYTQHAALFTQVYDLDDPSPYFSTLRPTGYRMPVALAGALEAIHAPLGAVRGAGHSPRLLDFACGYGAIGALLRHDVSMAEIYARYGERQWQPEDARRYWEADAAFFAAGGRNGRRSRSPVSTLPETRSITRPPWLCRSGLSRESRGRRSRRWAEAFPSWCGPGRRKRRSGGDAAGRVRARFRLRW